MMTMNSPRCYSSTTAEPVLLPFLPGYSFPDFRKTRYHINQSLRYQNGYIVPKVLPQGTQSLAFLPKNEAPTLHPSMIYGQLKKPNPKPFTPLYLINDKKVLRFYGYFKQSVPESPDALYCVRNVVMYYFLEDDTILVYEPPLDNSGIEQRRLIRRQKIPKNDLGEFYEWKDFNLGMTVFMFGRAIRITDCDRWTANFMASEGIDLNPVEETPLDPYMEKRLIDRPTMYAKTKSTFDALQQFLLYDKKVLRFNAIWDNRNNLYGELKPYTFLYFLADDTIEIREIHIANDGCDPVPIMMHRQKLPRDHQVNRNVVLETIPEDLDFYTAADLGIGKTINVYGRKFLLYDCDKFTQDYYRHQFGVTDFTPIPVKLPSKHKVMQPVAPYTGWGTPEDSLRSCLSFRPNPPPKDVIRLLEKGLMSLRYEAELDSVYEVDQNRRFIITYYPSDFTLRIYERPETNSGILGGPFLRRCRVQKPSSDPNNPVYYLPKDFEVGAELIINRRKFRITQSDKFVEKYRELYPEDFQDSDKLLFQPPANFRYLTKEEANRICTPSVPETEQPPTFPESEQPVY